jgi:hypothetical protein
MVVVSRRGFKGKVWETFRGRAFHGNVVLNFMRFPQGEFAAYGRSYHEAANHLVSSMDRGHYRDPDACPIVFLYRHAVELYLKAIIHWGNMLLRINNRSIVAHKNIFQEHRLGVLLRSVKPILKFRKQLDNWGDSHFDCLRDVEKIIGELDQYDPRSYSFRYPVETTGRKATLPHRFGFNVVAFGEKLDHLLQVLGWMADMVYFDFQSQAEAINELHNG